MLSVVVVCLCTGLVVTGISHGNLDITLSYTPYAGLDAEHNRQSGHAICIRPMPFLLTRYLTLIPDGAVIGGASVKISEAVLVFSSRSRTNKKNILGLQVECARRNAYYVFGYALWS